jgi:membrane protein
VAYRAAGPGFGDHEEMGEWFDRLVSGVERAVGALRRRYRLVDHVWRAQERYADVYGGRLAAANAYYGFFAGFALAALVFSVLGYVLRDNATVVLAVREYLDRNLPQLDADRLYELSQQVRGIAIVGLTLAGVAWVETLRSSQRALWGLEQQPGHFLVRWLVDLAVFVGLAVLLTVSFVLSTGAQDLLLRLLGGFDQSPIRAAVNGSSTAIAGGVDLLLAAAVLAGVPRLRMPLRRLFPPALLVAVGLWLLKTIGRWYVAKSQHNPAYQLVAGAVGLLLFMYLFHQLILFAAALAATSRHGTAMDLAAGRQPKASPPAAVPAFADLDVRYPGNSDERYPTTTEQARTGPSRAEPVRESAAPHAEMTAVEPTSVHDGRRGRTRDT